MARFSHQFLDELKNRLTLSDIVGRKVKLVRKGREHGGLCPFHSEKTPSFTVNDQKGFYHCFGCSAHGSAFDFMMETEGLSFPEAIERLAGEAGMALPIPDPEEAKRDERRATLSEVMESVTSWYETQLRGQVGKHALDYAINRGLSDQTMKRFRMGYAPNSRTALKEAMIARGIEEAQLIETGMLIKPEDGGDSYDRFRDRLMFPIGDQRERIIAFGGRALSSEVKAKYLNSPETSLFHKGFQLYNQARARKTAWDSGNVVVVEGYMDVIALSQFGIDYAVAPLGTALTEEQIKLLWRMADEPILSFDGDKAGQRAASRAVDRALPLLTPGKSLRFLLMPEGDDPDTLVQREGRPAFEKLMDAASPLVEMVWRGFMTGRDASTPERRAGLEKDIFTKLAEIEDENVKKLYQGELRNRLFEHFKPQRKAFTPWKKGGKNAPKPATGKLKETRLGRLEGTRVPTDRLEHLILLAVVNHPEVLISHMEQFASVTFHDEGHQKLAQEILYVADNDNILERETLEIHLQGEGLAAELRGLYDRKALKGDWFAWSEAALSDAVFGLEHVLARYDRVTGALSELKAAEAECARDLTEESQARYFAARQAYHDAAGIEASIEGYGLESNRTDTY